MYLLDTDTLTLFHAGHPKIGARRLQVSFSEVATTLVSRVEVLQGRFVALIKAAEADQLLRAQLRLMRTEQLLMEIPIIPFNEAAAAEFDKLRQVKKLKKLGRADVLIASIALAHKARLVTRNLKHFQQMPGLQIEDWTK